MGYSDADLAGANAQDALKKGAAREAQEADIMDQLRSGATTLDLFGLARWRDCAP